MTPVFRRPSKEQQESTARAADRAQRSLAALEAGGLPLAAQERLAALGGAFTSDLSVNEFAILDGLGVKPITQVMGSSIYQVGWQPQYFNVPTEVTKLSTAYNESRRLALGRLRAEARLAHADAVVGVRITSTTHAWAQGSIEFVAIGTAVRLPEGLRGSGDEALLTDLSGQEFVQLARVGVRAVGIVAHTSVHYVPASWQTAMATSGSLFGGGWRNQELVDFTAGVYAAREKAIGAAVAQASALEANGVVGVDISESAHTHRVNRGGTECEDAIKTETKASNRCIPLDQPGGSGKCIYCGKDSTEVAIFARAY